MPHGRVDRMLGGAATYISLAASYFTKVKIVAVVGDDFARDPEVVLFNDTGVASTNGTAPVRAVLG